MKFFAIAATLLCATQAAAVDVCVLKLYNEYPVDSQLVVEKENGDVIKVAKSDSRSTDTPKALIELASSLMDIQACQKIELRSALDEPPRS